MTQTCCPHNGPDCDRGGPQHKLPYSSKYAGVLPVVPVACLRLYRGKNNFLINVRENLGICNFIFHFFAPIRSGSAFSRLSVR
jgi:hypothetical protein